MDAQDYERWSAPLRAHPQATRCIVAANKVLTYLGYAVYPLLIAILLATGDSFALRALLVPAIAFVAVSLARKAINRPRPYETLCINPVIKKNTQGKSMPSRHAFSMAMIALTWLYWCPPVGMVLIVATIAMAIVRVLGGVHYPSDVLVGILVALACAIVGFWLI